MKKKNNLLYEMIIAFSTVDKKGLDDRIAEVFARAETFTLMDIDLNSGRVRNVKIIDNEAKGFSHGAGPIAIKILLDHGVRVIISPQIGSGIKELLKEKNIKFINVDAGKVIKNILNDIIECLKR